MKKLLTTLVGIGMIPLCFSLAQEIDPKNPNLAVLSKTTVEATNANLVGYYEHSPVTNDWHKGRIESGDHGKLRWKNAAGRSWSLEFRDNELWAGKDCPYGEMKYELKKDKSGKVLGFVAGVALYTRLEAANPQAQPAGDPNATYYICYYEDAVNKMTRISDAFTSSGAAYNQLLGRLGVDEFDGRYTSFTNRAAVIKAGKRLGN